MNLLRRRRLLSAKAEKVFKERKAHATLIVVSHSVATIRKNCDRAAVLHNGVLSEYDTLATPCASIRGFAMPDIKTCTPATQPPEPSPRDTQNRRDSKLRSVADYTRTR